MAKARSRHPRFFLILEIGTVILALALFVNYRRGITKIPADVLANVPPPRWDGAFPCVYATASPTSAPQIGSCATPVPFSKASRTSVDRFETDLRRGKFILRQTDLFVSGTGFTLPLTRTYTQDDWLPQNKSHAFGMNANHQYDIAPVGTRNPYTEQFIALEDGDFLYFPRVSKGTNYRNAIFRQSEVGNSFYKAVTRWDGDGWVTQLQDGSTILFPESYNAKNLAQGAATEMTDAAGEKVMLIRHVNRNLQEIRSPAGASIKLQEDNDGRIVRAEDGQAHWAKYVYNADGFLTDVVHSDGSARHYSYEKKLLTYVRDEQNRILLHNVYYEQGGWLLRQEFGNGDTIEYRYDVAENNSYNKAVILKLHDGSEKTIQIGDCISEVYKRIPAPKPEMSSILAAAQNGEWRRYRFSDPDQEFSVLLPATPEPTHLGLNTIQTKTDSASYTVIFRTDKFDRAIDQPAFEVWRAAALNEFFLKSRTGCELSSDEHAASVKLPSYFGSAFRMNCRIRGEAWTILGNLYLSQQHQYCVFVAFPTTGADPPSATRFLDSFKLINSTSRPPK